MNFVQLVNDALTECGTGQTTALTTVQTAPNAEVQRFINWVQPDARRGHRPVQQGSLVVGRCINRLCGDC